jgi:GNAT superfamily N-acetyltransferase
VPNLIPIRKVTATDEKRLIGVLSRSFDENAYLLGLIHDYSVAELSHMQWGWFFWCPSQRGIEGVLYIDTTGLAVLSPSSREALSSFADFVISEEFNLNRIISEETAARCLDGHLRERGSAWQTTLQVFEEDGMVLRRSDLAHIGEGDLRLAQPQEANEIAHGAAEAMLEELGLRTDEEEMERLIRSKVDLISRNRYFVLRADGRIVFQAFLSTALPEVALIQGVWVPRDRRGCGIATRCVAEMCHRALDYSDRILLRVQKRNLPAEAVYRKVGFKNFLNYLSIWYGA